jgi:cytosine/adenosine deaminase-related metal-dependent hydrolase
VAKQIYTSDWIIPITSPPIRNGVVVVDRKRIAFVGTEAELKGRPEFATAERTNFECAAIMPGFVNVHAHLELTLMRGFLEDLQFREWILKLTRTKYERLSNDDLKTSALLGVAEALRAGVTTIADTADSAGAFEAMLESGIRGIAYREVFGPDPSDAEKNLSGLRDKVNEMRAAETELARVGISPHAPYTVSPKLFSLASKYAQNESLDVCIHTAESGAEVELLMTGTGEFADGLAARGIEWHAPRTSTVDYFSSIGVLETAPLLVHCVQLGYQDFDLIVQSGSRVAHCPKSNAKLGHGVASLLSMCERGVTIGLGTDSVASNNRCDMLEEARFCGLIHRVHTIDPKTPSADYLLRLATLGGAEAVHLDREIGSLEVGKQADFIAIDLSQTHNTPIHDPIATIVFSATSSDVMFIAVAGRVLFDRELKTLDEQDLRRRVNSSLQHIYGGR